MPAWNPNDYETVDTRIHRFYESHQSGRIVTELVYRDERQYIVKAYAYRVPEDVEAAATGYAEELVGSSPVNRTSALENCETSAIGRCLANLGFSPKGSRPSLEEMQKADRKPRLTEDVAQAMILRMRTSSSISDLVQAAEELATFDMPDDTRDGLRSVYLERKSELEAVAS